jgi:hypothetical protein
MSNLSFSIIPTSSPDLIAPGRGAQHWGTTNWDDKYVPKVPAGNSKPLNYYTRFNWKDIETDVKGVYTWTTFDNFVHQAMDNNAMFSFGIMVYCNGCGTFGQLPAFVVSDMQKEGKPAWSDGGFMTPNYQAVSLINNQVDLLKTVANHINTSSYNGKSFKSAFLGYDIRHFGNFGEGNGIATSAGCPSGAQVTDDYVIKMIDNTIAIFPDVQLTAPTSYSTPYGNSYGNKNGMVGEQAAWYILTAKNNYGRIGWRRDNLGDDGYNALITGNTGSYNPGSGVVQLKPLLTDMWKFAPIGGEPANDLNGTSRCGSIQCDLLNEITNFHMSYFGNGNFPIMSSTSTALVNAVINASKASGYRLVTVSGTISDNIVNNTAFNITLNWQNIGIAPVYENWNVVYELRDSLGKVVWSGNSKFDPKLFLPQSTSTPISDNFTLSGITAGSYNLYLMIKDPLGYKKPLPLAISGVNTDGSYLVKSNLVVGAGTGTPSTSTSTSTTRTTTKAPSSSTTSSSTTTSTTKAPKRLTAIDIDIENNKVTASYSDGTKILL